MRICCYHIFQIYESNMNQGERPPGMRTKKNDCKELSTIMSTYREARPWRNLGLCTQAIFFLYLIGINHIP